MWDYPRPAWFGYGFVGFAGVQKMSSSAGGAPTAQDALRVLEPGILRWLYVRRQPKQAFDIDFGQEVVRLYDEWDALARKATDPEKRDVQTLAYERASSTATAGPLPTPEVVVPFRMLASVADVTAGSAEQISRLIGTMGYPHDSVEQLEPRLSRAMAWTEEFVPASDRTTVRSEPDAVAIEALSSQEREWLSLLLQGLQGDLELDAMTSLVYGVPKLARGMPLDEKPTDEVKADQKEFFRLLYHLLVDAERGPRLPTLIVALGAEPGAAAARRLAQQGVRGRGAGVAQEVRAALPLVVLADRVGGQGERGQATQEAPVGLVLPRHGAVALPAVAAEQVEAAVVPDPGVGVDGHVVGALVAGLVGQRGPGERRGRVTAYDGGRAVAARELGGGRVVGEVRGRRSGHQVDVAHAARLSRRADEIRHH